MTAARLGAVFYWLCMALVAALIVTGAYEFWLGVNDPRVTTWRTLAGPTRCVMGALVAAAVGHTVRRFTATW